ncbi:MAG: hypothetical protein V3S89_01515 [Desulfobacterales bacterium]
MKRAIVVADSSREECRKLCNMLESWHYQAVPMHSLKDLDEYVENNQCLAVILDVDTVAVDNRAIGMLSKKNPDIYLLCLSESRFHPELQEAIGNYFYASLNKPVDPDELSYWLNSIIENDQ